MPSETDGASALSRWGNNGMTDRRKHRRDRVQLVKKIDIVPDKAKDNVGQPKRRSKKPLPKVLKRTRGRAKAR
jgi:hypothetical protein